jgi:hypothetical protein
VRDPAGIPSALSMCAPCRSGLLAEMDGGTEKTDIF